MQAVGPRCRQCVQCGNAIEGKGRIDRLYCSPSCNTLAWRVRVDKRWGGRPKPGTGTPQQVKLPSLRRPTLAGLGAELESAASREAALQQRLDLQTAELKRIGDREAALQQRLDLQTAELKRIGDREAALQRQVSELKKIGEQVAKRDRETTERNEELATENEHLQRQLNGLMQAHSKLLSAEEHRRKLAAGREKSAHDRDERPAERLGTSRARTQPAAAKKKSAGPLPVRQPEPAREASQAHAPWSIFDGPVYRPRQLFPTQTPVPNPTQSLVKRQAAPLPMQRRPAVGVAQPTVQVGLAVRNPLPLTAVRPAEVPQKRTTGVNQEKPTPKRKPRRKGPAKAPRKKKSSWLAKAASAVAGAAAGVAIGFGLARATKR